MEEKNVFKWGKFSTKNILDSQRAVFPHSRETVGLAKSHCTELQRRQRAEADMQNIRYGGKAVIAGI